MVELVDGRSVNRDSDEWRHECFARWVLGHALDARRILLAEYEAKHGAEAAQRLRGTVMALHEKARAARAGGEA